MQETPVPDEGGRDDRTSGHRPKGRPGQREQGRDPGVPLSTLQRVARDVTAERLRQRLTVQRFNDAPGVQLPLPAPEGNWS